MQLETWFDGEAPEGLAWHVATCARCFRHVDTLSRIRGAVRAGLAAPLAADGDAAAMTPPPATRRTVRARALVAVPVVLALVSGLLVGVGRVGLHGTLSAHKAAAGHAVRNDGGIGAAVSAAAGDSGAPASGSSLDAPGTAASGSAPRALGGLGSAASGALGALTIGVVVPTEGAAAADGTEITKAVQKAVAEADASGGVRGLPVQLTVVPAEDGAAVAALAGRVDAVVGGFGAALPVGMPWILPADPWASGSGVVATELSPLAAGARLGLDLIQRGEAGTVGVIEGTGPDADLGRGLASEVPTTTVQAPASGACLPAVTALEQQGVTAVAVAGSPALATSCLSATAAAAWAPPGGVLLPPSSAYAGIASTGVGSGVYTVLGLPWPASSSPGATRFRAALPGVTSYRALVSYAAVELAVDVARIAGLPSAASMAGRSWRNDLYDFAGADNAGVQVVQAAPQGWVSAP